MIPLEPISPAPPHLLRRCPLAQSWRHVSFVHWPCSPRQVRPLLPPRTEPDIAEGSAWIGVVALRFESVHLLGVPVFPTPAGVTELNVRTYSVDAQGRRGIVFLTMEMSNAALAFGARTTTRLPYRWADVDVDTSGGIVECRAQRHGPGGAGIGFRIRPRQPVEPTNLDHFLTARWRLHTRWWAVTAQVPIRHEPWRLRAGELQEFSDSGLLADAGVPAPEHPPRVLYSVGTTVTFGLPSVVGPATGVAAAP